MFVFLWWHLCFNHFFTGPLIYLNSMWTDQCVITESMQSDAVINYLFHLGIFLYRVVLWGSNISDCSLHYLDFLPCFKDYPLSQNTSWINSMIFHLKLLFWTKSQMSNKVCFIFKECTFGAVWYIDLRKVRMNVGRSSMWQRHILGEVAYSFTIFLQIRHRLLF